MILWFTFSTIEAEAMMNQKAKLRSFFLRAVTMLSVMAVEQCWGDKIHFHSIDCSAVVAFKI